MENTFPTGHPDQAGISPDTARLIFCALLSIFVHALLAWHYVKPGGIPTGPRILQVEILPLGASETPSEPVTREGSNHELETAIPKEYSTDPPSIEQPSSQTTRETNVARSGLPMDIYYRSSEVDQRAEPLNDVDLIYPLAPYKKRISGVVRVSVYVNEYGQLDKVTVLESIPPGVFDEAALQAINQLRFSPAIKDGRQVKNVKTVEIVFDPSERAGNSSRQLPNSSATGK